MRIRFLPVGLLLLVGLLSWSQFSAAADPPSDQERSERRRSRRQRDGQRRGPRGDRPADKLQQGNPAPDFNLKSVDGKRKVRLSSFQGKKPVALIFGSYT